MLFCPAMPMEYAHEEYLGRPSCPKCGKLCILPEATAHDGERVIEHVWVCDSCGNEFRTAVKIASSPNPSAHTSRKDSEMAKKAKRASRRVWTSQDVRELKRHSRAKSPVAVIAKRLKRTAGAIRQKALHLDLAIGHRR